MKRRDFIKTAVPAVVIPSLISGMPVTAFAENPYLNSLLATNTTNIDRVLVIIALSGGNDGLNMVIPIDQYSELSVARSNVLINQSSVLPLTGTTTTGLHPSMTGLQTLYDEGKLSIVQSVGYPNPNFSHFRATDIWTSASDSTQILSTGWVGRYFDTEFSGYPTGYPNAAMPDPLAIQIGTNLPLMFQAANGNTVMTVNSAASLANWATGVQDPVPNTPAGDELAYIRMVAQQTQQYSQSIITAYSQSVTQYAGYPAAGTNLLADSLKAVAKLIKGGLKTRMYLVGGLKSFDTHSDQVVSGSTSTGDHASLLSQLSDAIFAFQRDLELLQINDRVIGMTLSEFGRRIQSNGSLGTDHGAAAPMLVFGSKAQGGILGTNPQIPAVTTVNDNVPMQYDFRSVYSSILKDWFCVSSTALSSVLLQNFQYLPVVNADCTGIAIEDVLKSSDLISISNYPNPFTDKTTLQFQTLGGHTLIQIFDPLGRLIAVPVNAQYVAGNYAVSFDCESLPVGNYYCRLQNGPLQKVSLMQIVK